MRLHRILFFLFVLLLPALGQQSPRDSSGSDSLPLHQDSLPAPPAPLLGPVFGPALFQYQHILVNHSPGTGFKLSSLSPGTLSTQATRFTLNLLPPARQKGNPFLQPKPGFQNSTAFNFDYSEKIRREDDLKPEYGNSAAVVPILSTAVLAYYGAKEAYLALRPSPPLQIDSADAAILELIWEQREITAVGIYEQISQNAHFKRLTFMPVQQRLDKLKRLGIIDSRPVENGAPLYHTRLSRTELQKKIEQRLREAAAGNSDKSVLALQSMLRLLSD